MVIYGFGAQGLVMKQHTWHSFSTTHSSFVDSYDAWEMAQLLNESVYKAAEEAWAEEMHKKIEEEVTIKLSV